VKTYLMCTKRFSQRDESVSFPYRSGGFLTIENLVPRSEIIAVQIHGGKAMEIQFKDIRSKKLQKPIGPWVFMSRFAT